MPPERACRRVPRSKKPSCGSCMASRKANASTRLCRAWSMTFPRLYSTRRSNWTSNGSLNVSGNKVLHGSFCESPLVPASVACYDALDDKGRLLIDPRALMPCEICGTPIPVPRLSAIPNCRKCIECASEQESASQPPSPPHPHPPADRQECPKCGKPTVVRQNNKDQNYLLGCTGFPKCNWTSPIEIQQRPLRDRVAGPS
jgi:hypothetical protein